ncbi:MAG: hypothetical protein M3Q97_10535, partial [Bacteroidota bacterium]|nr:hypothetical protein [Bacteroidota bacterium]
MPEKKITISKRCLKRPNFEFLISISKLYNIPATGSIFSTMQWINRLFGSKKNELPLEPPPQLLVDMHCHILPGIDDGVDDWDE